MASRPFTFDPLTVVTTPGGHHLGPFSPPAGFCGGPGDYMLLLRMRYKNEEYARYFREHVQAYKAGAQIAFEGPYASEAMSILAKLEGSYMKKAG